MNELILTICLMANPTACKTINHFPPMPESICHFIGKSTLGGKWLQDWSYQIRGWKCRESKFFRV